MSTIRYYIIYFKYAFTFIPTPFFNFNNQTLNFITIMPYYQAKYIFHLNEMSFYFNLMKYDLKTVSKLNSCI
jgi:hypothetical protein